MARRSHSVLLRLLRPVQVVFMMTKRDYETVAAVLKQIQEDAPIQKITVLREVAEEVADAFYDQNPRFDRDRFLKACEP